MSSSLVLNVNDHAANLYMVSKMLRNAGYRVAEARNGGEALAQIERERPALVVLDVRLPDMSGFEVCRKIRANPATHDIKVLHTSATFITTENKIEGLEAGADGYLTQPFEPQDLIATVRSLIRLYDAERVLLARNEELLAADRRKDEFLAMLAHELRNPLAAVQSGLPLLERFPARDEIETRTREIMKRQTSLLIQLVDDLLDVSRVTRGRIELHKADIDLVPLVAKVCDGIRERVLSSREQTLEVELPSRPIVIDGDPGRLEQILTNLLDNASKYSDPGTTITVTFVERDGRAVVSVRDRGIGIDAATLPTVFDLFAQAKTSLARSRGGLGIGLTLVRTLVEMHGGTIRAASAGLGKGTEMTLELPVRQAPARNPTPPLSYPAIKEGHRSVLLVDDNDDGRELLRSLCELDGHTVSEAPDGTTGVEAALSSPPDIAFIDIGLPGIDGYEVARRIKAQLDGTSPYLVALSGYGSAAHKQRAFEAGFDEHVAKPIASAHLRRLIATAPAKNSGK
jgi:signal transduction histidine kinase